MKSFTLIQTIGSFVVILVMIIVWGVPLAPTIMYYQFVNELVSFENEWAHALGTGLVLSSSFVVYSICLLLFSSLLQFILHVRVKEKIVVPLASFTTISWAFCGQILR